MPAKTFNLAIPWAAFALGLVISFTLGPWAWSTLDDDLEPFVAFVLSICFILLLSFSTYAFATSWRPWPGSGVRTMAGMGHVVLHGATVVLGVMTSKYLCPDDWMFV